MRWFAASILLSFLSGCLGGSDDLRNEPMSDPSSAAHPPGTGHASDGAARTPPLFDAWGNASEIMLFAGRVESDPACWSIQGASARYGCAYFTLDRGTLVPEGTRALRVRGDSSAATRHGTWAVHLDHTYGRSWLDDDPQLRTVPSDGDVSVWEIPLLPPDWDIPTHERSAFFFNVTAWGEGANLLAGPVSVEIAALRDPGWQLVPAVDHFQRSAAHNFTPEGSILLLDEVVGLRQPLSLTKSARPGIGLRDIVPIGTRQVTVGIGWVAIEGCPTPLGCDVVVRLLAGAERIFQDEQGVLAASGPGYKIYRYEAPSQVGEDGSYANESRTRVDALIGYACVPGYVRYTCYGEWATEMSADVHIIAEAWDREADVAAVQGRLVPG